MNLTQAFKNQPLPIRIGIVVLGILLVSIIIRSFGSDNSIDAEPVGLISTPEVSLANVTELGNKSTALSLVGKVTSLNEASIRSETPGTITTLRVKLGDVIGAGSIIATLSNDTERAQLLQAEGAYEASRASLAKVQSGARSEQRDISNLSVTAAKANESESQRLALTTITNTFATLDDAIRGKTDTLFTNPRSRSATLNVEIPDTRLSQQIERERMEIEELLQSRELRLKTLTTSSALDAELSQLDTETRILKSYLDDVITGLGKLQATTQLPQTTIDGYRASATLARSMVGGALANISNSRDQLSAKKTASEIAIKQQTQTVSGERPEDIQIAQAGVTQALGNLRASQARYEKTIIRSPISGTVNSLSITLGDFVGAYEPVAVVGNNGALEIIIGATEESARELAVGQPVLIEGTTKGIITRIASALDPKTQKIEIRIGVVDQNDTLVNGASVRVEFTREHADATKTTNEISLPLASIKMTPDGAFVFTVTASSTIEAHKIELGAIQGEVIRVEKGITSDMVIVTDARGLKPGETVIVKN